MRAELHSQISQRSGENVMFRSVYLFVSLINPVTNLIWNLLNRHLDV